jgi:hypothetical protein
MVSEPARNLVEKLPLSLIEILNTRFHCWQIDTYRNFQQIVMINYIAIVGCFARINKISCGLGAISIRARTR